MCPSQPKRAVDSRYKSCRHCLCRKHIEHFPLRRCQILTDDKDARISICADCQAKRRTHSQKKKALTEDDQKGVDNNTAVVLPLGEFISALPAPINTSIHGAVAGKFEFTARLDISMDVEKHGVTTPKEQAEMVARQIGLNTGIRWVCVELVVLYICSTLTIRLQ
jgi:hypothetical protein